MNKLNYIDKTGLRFGRLRVLGLDRIFRGRGNGPGKNRATSMWRCLCDCGKTKIVKSYLLAGGRTRSCGCISWEIREKRCRTHGMSGTPTYKSWQHMIRRCYSPREKRYPDYGGRGIKICDAWRSFENFYWSMGVKPDGMTLDRIDVNGNYEPKNCRWTDRKTQSQNQRPRKRIEQFTDADFVKEITRRWLGKQGFNLSPAGGVV